MNISFFGGLAQLGEHLPYKQEVTGSSPVSSIVDLSTIKINLKKVKFVLAFKLIFGILIIVLVKRHHDPLVKWLRHGPFTAVTWVQIPYGSLWRISSAGRASALQAGGHRFEPCILHRSKTAVLGSLFLYGTNNYQIG